MGGDESAHTVEEEIAAEVFAAADDVQRRAILDREANLDCGQVLEDRGRSGFGLGGRAGEGDRCVCARRGAPAALTGVTYDDAGSQFGVRHTNFRYTWHGLSMLITLDEGESGATPVRVEHSVYDAGDEPIAVIDQTETYSLRGAEKNGDSVIVRSRTLGGKDLCPGGSADASLTTSLLSLRFATTRYC